MENYITVCGTPGEHTQQFGTYEGIQLCLISFGANWISWDHDHDPTWSHMVRLLIKSTTESFDKCQDFFLFFIADICVSTVIL